MRLILSLTLFSLSIGAANAKEAYPDCLDKFPVIKGDWITNKSETSTDTLKAFNKFNFLGAFALYGRKITPPNECKDGQATVNTSLFNSFDENERLFIGCSMRLFKNSWCGTKNLLPALPSFYLSTIQTVQRIYPLESDLPTAYFTYPLLAINDVVRGNPKAAQEKIKTIQTSCTKDGTTHPAKAGECWKRFDESLFSDPDKIYTVLDGIREIAEDNGISYETGKYDEIRLQSNKLKGSRVRFQITVAAVFPGETSNQINAYVGNYSLSRAAAWTKYGKAISEFKEISSKRDSPRIIIRVPESLSKNLIHVETGDVLTIKGKANGLEMWGTEEIGAVPLINAEKIEQ